MLPLLGRECPKKKRRFKDTLHSEIIRDALKRLTVKAEEAYHVNSKIIEDRFSWLDGYWNVAWLFASVPFELLPFHYNCFRWA